MLRTRWPFNFMEFLSRLLSAAPSLLALPRPTTILIPGMPSIPAFYEDLLSPIGKLESMPATQYLRGRSFSAATFCCINSLRLPLNRTAVATLIHRIRRHHLGPKTRPPTSMLHATAGAVVSLVDRAAPPPTSTRLVRLPFKSIKRSHASRAITTAAQLLDDCNNAAKRKSSSNSCSRLRFPPEVSFATALESLSTTTVLVGVHGAGLANAVFLPQGAAVVEILPAGFAKPGSFAITPDKYGWLKELGLRRYRLVARETAPGSCASVAERLRKQWERMRDCDVNVSWAEVDKVLKKPLPDYSKTADAMAAMLAPHEKGESRVESRARAQEALELFAAHRNESSWRCTMWPQGATGTSDEARCLHGNSLHDGYEYAHNVNRGTPHAMCLGQCACCRRWCFPKCWH